MGTKELIANLFDPGPEYTMIPFWFLNGDLQDEKIVASILEFKRKGINGFVLHPRMGIPQSIPYLSDTFMHYIKTAVETASKEGMLVVLYDEGMYPSGSAHGMIVKENPDFASIGITLSDDPLSEKVIAKINDGRYLVQRQSGGTIRGIHFGEDDGEKNAPKSADILNPDVVDLFIKLTHERYYEWLKEYFGNTIIGFFTDEPSILGRNTKGFFPWTNGLEEEITKRGGVLSDLAALFERKENATTALYHQIILERECKVYYKKLSSWCEAHDIALMGHPHQSDDIEVQQYFHIPGQDLALRFVAPEMGGLNGMDTVMGKCSSDAARIWKRRRNSNECFGACNRGRIPWYLTGSDIKWYFDWLAVRGVNLFIPHAFYYSIEGKRKEERPPDVGPNSIWWEHYEKLSGYGKRLSYLGCDTISMANVAVLCKNRDLQSDKVKALYENQIEFQYVPVSQLDQFKEEEGRLVKEGSTFSFIAGNPDCFLKAKSIEKIVAEAPHEMLLDKKCPSLRVMHVKKEDRECFFLVNEGEEPISTKAAVKDSDAENESLVGYDLWNNQSFLIPSVEREGKLFFDLILQRRESLLIVKVMKSEVDELHLALKRKLRFAIVSDFKMTGEEKESLKKIYEGTFSYDGGEEQEGDETDNATDIVLSIKASEMAEYYVNDVFAGFTMWNPHQIIITPYLRKGRNQVRVVITGNLANLYSDAVIPYGMTEI